MKCQAVRDRLSGYLEHDLPSAQHQEIAQHLDLCASCRAEAESLRAAEQALQTLSVLESAPDLLADLRRRIAVSPGKSRRWAWGGVAVAIAAAALLVLFKPAAKTVPSPSPRPSVARANTQEPPPVIAVAPPSASQPPVASSVRPEAHRVAPPRRQGEARKTNPPAVIEAPAAEAETTPAAPVEAAPMTGGIILILGDPIPPLTESRCRLELTLADGTRSVYERNTKPGQAGQPDTIAVAYERTDPDTTTTD